MSFQDMKLSPPMHSQALVFQINTAVARYRCLVNNIGTYKDTVDLRQRLYKTRIQIRELMKKTKAEFDRLGETNKFTRVSATAKIADSKIRKDYEAALKEYDKIELVAAEKEKGFAHPIANATCHQRYESPSGGSFEVGSCSSCTCSTKAGEMDIYSLRPKHTTNRQMMCMENEISTIIEEREEAIKEIQVHIGEVTEIVRDLALLVKDQGALIGNVSSDIEASHSATANAATDLVEASNIQSSSSSMVCLMLFVVVIILLIVFFVYVFNL